MGQAMKSGIGSASLTLGSGVMVAALVAVNAVGDVIDPATNKIVAGARLSVTSREFVDSAAALRHASVQSPDFRGNTTLAVVATNARLDRVQTNKLAALASIGVTRTISPVNTMSDGDITFALSLGNERASIDSVGAAASEVLAMAVLRAVRAAKTAGGIPGLAG
jgi:L-aminopeptidase/D-esterase-like protein